jgi:hypothetical protein
MPVNTYKIKFTIEGTDIGIPPVSEITINIVGPNCQELPWILTETSGKDLGAPV